MDRAELAHFQHRQSTAEANARTLVEPLSDDDLLTICEIWARAGKRADAANDTKMILLYMFATTAMMREYVRRQEDSLGVVA